MMESRTLDSSAVALRPSVMLGWTSVYGHSAPHVQLVLVMDIRAYSAHVMGWSSDPKHDGGSMPSSRTDTVVICHEK